MKDTPLAILSREEFEKAKPELQGEAWDQSSTQQALEAPPKLPALKDDGMPPPPVPRKRRIALEDGQQEKLARYTSRTPSEADVQSIAGDIASHHGIKPILEGLKDPVAHARLEKLTEGKPDFAEEPEAREESKKKGEDAGHCESLSDEKQHKSDIWHEVNKDYLEEWHLRSLEQKRKKMREHADEGCAASHQDSASETNGSSRRAPTSSRRKTSVSSCTQSALMGLAKKGKVAGNRINLEALETRSNCLPCSFTAMPESFEQLLDASDLGIYFDRRYPGWDDPPKLSMASPVRRLQYLDEALRGNDVEGIEEGLRELDQEVKNALLRSLLRNEGDDVSFLLLLVAELGAHLYDERQGRKSERAELRRERSSSEEALLNGFEQQKALHAQQLEELSSELDLARRESAQLQQQLQILQASEELRAQKAILVAVREENEGALEEMSRRLSNASGAWRDEATPTTSPKEAPTRRAVRAKATRVGDLAHQEAQTASLHSCFLAWRLAHLEEKLLRESSESLQADLSLATGAKDTTQCQVEGCCCRRQAGQAPCCRKIRLANVQEDLKIAKAALSTRAGYGILDSGCSRTLIGQETLNQFMRLYQARGLLVPAAKQQHNLFKFGNGHEELSERVVSMPVCIHGKMGRVEAAIIKGSARLLLSRNTLKSLKAVLDFEGETLSVQGGVAHPLQVNAAGQYILNVLDERAEVLLASCAENDLQEGTLNMPVEPSETLLADEESLSLAPHERTSEFSKREHRCLLAQKQAWAKENGRGKVAELFSPPRFAEKARQWGAAGLSYDIKQGWDLTKVKHQQMVDQELEESRPELLTTMDSKARDLLVQPLLANILDWQQPGAKKLVTWALEHEDGRNPFCTNIETMDPQERMDLRKEIRELFEHLWQILRDRDPGSSQVNTTLSFLIKKAIAATFVADCNIKSASQVSHNRRWSDKRAGLKT
eukprot:g24016.t1